MAEEKLNIPMWLQRIQRCEDLQAEKTNERRQINKLYTGTFFGSPLSNQSNLTEVNFLYEYMDVLIAAIYSRNPHIFVRSRSSKLSAFAETMEKVANFYWWEKKAKKKVHACIKDAVMQPPGFIGIGYTLDIEQDTEGQSGILDETIKSEDIFIKHISSWNILWPDGYHNFKEQAPYMIEREVVSLEDLLLNPFYKKEVVARIPQATGNYHTVQKVKPFKMSADIPVGSNTYQLDKETIPITLYHIWDKRTHKRFTLAKNFIENTLFEGVWDYLIDGFCYYPLIFNEIPQTDEKANSYPLSDVVPMIPQLKELSYISSAMNRHRRRAGTLILAKKGTITETDATNIQNAHDVDVVLLPELTEAAVRTFVPPALPTDFYKLRDVVLQDLMRQSGFQQLLYSVRGIETATESENVRAGALLRQSYKTDIIEDFTVEIARGLAGIIWQFIPREKIERIIGETVTEEMWPILPEDLNEARKIIQEEFQFRIDAGSTKPPKDEAVERKQWVDLAGSIKANFPNRVKDDIFLRQLLKKYDFHDIEEMIISFDDEEIAVAQEENKLLMQAIPQLVSPNENDMLHLQVHGQIYQTPGLKPTPQLDEHVDRHAKNLERKSPKVIPQRGDTKIAPPSTTPELGRAGVTEGVDIMGAVRNLPGTGGNLGGK